MLAHELAHIANRDVLIGSIAAAVATGISFMANMAMWGAAFGGNDDEDRHANPLALFVAALFAPIAAALLQMALSRGREYEADRAGARLAGSGESLARALAKLERAAAAVPMPVQPAQAHKYIVNPLTGRRIRFAALFATHPPTDQRNRPPARPPGRRPGMTARSTTSSELPEVEPASTGDRRPRSIIHPTAGPPGQEPPRTLVPAASPVAAPGGNVTHPLLATVQAPGSARTSRRRSSPRSCRPEGGRGYRDGPIARPAGGLAPEAASPCQSARPRLVRCARRADERTLPTLATPVRPVRAHPLEHPADELIGQLAFAAVTSQAQLDRGVDVPADRLAVHSRRLGDRPLTLTPQPQPQHLSNLDHTNLPVRHRHLPDPSIGGGESTGNGTAAGGPRVVPSLADRWSHAPGGTHLKVVPRSWRATTWASDSDMAIRPRVAVRMSTEQRQGEPSEVEPIGSVARRRQRGNGVHPRVVGDGSNDVGVVVAGVAAPPVGQLTNGHCVVG